MKSKLFRKKPLDSEEITKDLAKLLSLSRDVSESLPQVAVELTSAPLSEEQQGTLEEASLRIGVDQATILENLSLINFFLAQFAPDEEYTDDSMEDVADDLLELSGSHESVKLRLVHLLETIRNVAQTTYSAAKGHVPFAVKLARAAAPS